MAFGFRKTCSVILASLLFKNNLVNEFIFGCWVFAVRLFLAVASGAWCPVAVRGLLAAVASLVAERRARAGGLQ